MKNITILTVIFLLVYSLLFTPSNRFILSVFFSKIKCKYSNHTSSSKIDRLSQKQTQSSKFDVSVPADKSVLHKTNFIKCAPKNDFYEIGRDGEFKKVYDHNIYHRNLWSIKKQSHQQV